MCACVHASVHLCVSDRSLDSPVFVVFVVLRAPGGCAHFKGPSELWGLETWDCAAQLAPGHGFTERMWAERVNWAETGSHKPPLHSSRQQSRLKDSAPACQRETLPFCGHWLGSDLYLNLPSLSRLLCCFKDGFFTFLVHIQNLSWLLRYCISSPTVENL